MSAKDSDGDTPLHWILEWPNAPPELVRLLLDHGANANEQNNKSRGFLYKACLMGNVSGVRLLLNYVRIPVLSLVSAMTRAHIGYITKLV